MSRLHALKVALEHAEQERDAALRAMQRAAAQLEAAERQAAQLEDYRTDYQKRWSQQFQREGTVDILQCYQNFMSRLNAAIEQQQRVVAQARAGRQRCQAVLVERETRAASIRKLIERREAEEALAQRRREQKATDEQASRLAWAARVHVLTA
ncbi:flagellar export protein FliJ [Caldimonas thermodepolymerans]|uniref:Flagellar FliJ protein n=1 Tax=Caldimonas thermodepolymerans TaxID=215580 RepID=A0A2S5T0K0_9BURK|nr:flagellar export protein FliJ [Caldimonas thermodepolymerans]PPE68472.1 flagellar export protein FliJ [Caldimonas thermodepolymerans]QPC30789.1 flagellar export protein FliJ [Caldimonas thermodepolymerans]RDI02590.1 flagellar FliJ protein [Caldimonas thermodepolymerans]TCP08882.1 flagellar FliJ protein [Caldimonas thermodepolymerans]UZG43529.1 flagellar export protein FliJ [Caldimonas thermodepolymerans]